MRDVPYYKRHKSPPLTEAEKVQVLALKDQGFTIQEIVQTIDAPRRRIYLPMVQDYLLSLGHRVPVLYLKAPNEQTKTPDQIVNSRRAAARAPVDPLVLLRKLPRWKIGSLADQLNRRVPWDIACRTAQIPAALLSTQECISLLRSAVDLFRSGSRELFPIKNQAVFSQSAFHSDTGALISASDPLDSREEYGTN